MVTARSFGPRRKRARQRAASTRSAVESGPPDTASTRAGHCARSANKAAASVDETGGSAAGTLLFPLDALLHVGRGAGIFAPDFEEGGASRLLFLERRERLTEPHQRVRRLAGFFERGRDVEEGFGGLTVALALKQAFAEPIIRFGHHPVARMLAQEAAEALLGNRIILAHQIIIGEVVFLLGRGGGGSHRLLLERAGGVRGARRRRRQCAARRRSTRCRKRGIARRVPRQRRQIERRAGLAAAGNAD